MITEIVLLILEACIDLYEYLYHSLDELFKRMIIVVHVVLGIRVGYVNKMVVWLVLHHVWIWVYLIIVKVLIMVMVDNLIDIKKAER